MVSNKRLGRRKAKKKIRKDGPRIICWMKELNSLLTWELYIIIHPDVSHYSLLCLVFLPWEFDLWSIKQAEFVKSPSPCRLFWLFCSSIHSLCSNHLIKDYFVRLEVVLIFRCWYHRFVKFRPLQIAILWHWFDVVHWFAVSCLRRAFRPASAKGSQIVIFLRRTEERSLWLILSIIWAQW